MNNDSSFRRNRILSIFVIIAATIILSIQIYSLFYLDNDVKNTGSTLTINSEENLNRLPGWVEISNKEKVFNIVNYTFNLVKGPEKINEEKYDLYYSSSMSPENASAVGDNKHKILSGIRLDSIQDIMVDDADTNSIILEYAVGDTCFFSSTRFYFPINISTNQGYTSVTHSNDCVNESLSYEKDSKQITILPILSHTCDVAPNGSTVELSGIKASSDSKDFIYMMKNTYNIKCLKLNDQINPGDIGYYYDQVTNTGFRLNIFEFGDPNKIIDTVNLSLSYDKGLTDK